MYEVIITVVAPETLIPGTNEIEPAGTQLFRFEFETVAPINQCLAGLAHEALDGHRLVAKFVEYGDPSPFVVR